MSKQPHCLLVYWCDEGLEYIGDLTEDQHSRMMAKLTGQPYVSDFPNIMHLELRARFNSQRFYECWLIQVEESDLLDQLKILFEQNPQQAADLVRSRGTRLFGHGRSEQDRRKVIA
jgi:hypothetical protein